MTEFTKLTPSYQGGEFAKPEHVIEVQEAFAPIESELADHDGRLTAAEAITPLVRQPNYVAALGDSITLGGNGSLNNTEMPDNSYFTHLCLLSGGALVPVGRGVRGVPSETSTQIAARADDVVALTPQPARCFVMAGTNDCNGSLSMAAYAANIGTIVTTLQEAGIEPIVLSIPPKNSNGDEVARVNAWLSLYGARNGVQVIDLYTPYQDAVTGGWQSDLSGDGVHPDSATCKAMAQLVWDAIKDRISPKTSPILTAHQSDTANLAVNGVFIGDTNSDGVANNWAEFSGSVGANDSLVSGGVTVPGNWQKAELAYTATGYWRQVISTGFTVGDILLFAGRLRTSVSGSEYASARLLFTNGSPARVVPAYLIKQNYGDDGAIFSVVAPVPVGTTSLEIQLMANGASGSGTVEFAQVTVRNLTALGLA